MGMLILPVEFSPKSYYNKPSDTKILKIYFHKFELLLQIDTNSYDNFLI